jgi:hypothetical protein
MEINLQDAIFDETNATRATIRPDSQQGMLPAHNQNAKLICSLVCDMHYGCA